MSYCCAIGKSEHDLFSVDHFSMAKLEFDQRHLADDQHIPGYRNFQELICVLDQH